MKFNSIMILMILMIAPPCLSAPFKAGTSSLSAIKMKQLVSRQTSDKLLQVYSGEVCDGSIYTVETVSACEKEAEAQLVKRAQLDLLINAVDSMTLGDGRAPLAMQVLEKIGGREVDAKLSEIAINGNFLALMHFGRRCEQWSLDSLLKHPWPMPSHVWAGALEQFGICNYKKATNLLIASLDAASLNVEEVAIKALQAMYPTGPMDAWGTEGSRQWKDWLAIDELHLTTFISQNSDSYPELNFIIENRSAVAQAIYLNIYPKANGTECDFDLNKVLKNQNLDRIEKRYERDASSSKIELDSNSFIVVFKLLNFQSGGTRLPCTLRYELIEANSNSLILGGNFRVDTSMLEPPVPNDIEIDDLVVSFSSQINTKSDIIMTNVLVRNTKNVGGEFYVSNKSIQGCDAELMDQLNIPKGLGSGVLNISGLSYTSFFTSIRTNVNTDLRKCHLNVDLISKQNQSDLKHLNIPLLVTGRYSDLRDYVQGFMPPPEISPREN